MKTFMLWMEELKEKKELTNNLLSRLGFSHDALEEGDIMLDQIPFKNLKAAIESLPISNEEKQKTAQWAMAHKHESLTNLINQINPLSFEKQDKTISQPAVLPQGQGQVPNPPNPQMQQQAQPQQMM